MRERPIIFSGESVRAILDGQKTMTRRVTKLPDGVPSEIIAVEQNSVGDWNYIDKMFPSGGVRYPFPACPFGKRGDTLWVRETWRFLGTDMHRHGRTHMLQDGVVEYTADGRQNTIETDFRNVEQWMGKGPKGRPSIHLPRWASRLTLEITGVRVERLANISEIDCENELGAHPYSLGNDAYSTFQELWNKINGKKHPWESNPWVWVIEFIRL